MMSSFDDAHDPIRLFLASLPRLAAVFEAQLAQCSSALDVAWAVCDYAGRALELDDCVVYLTDAAGTTVSQYAAWGGKRVARQVLENRIVLRFGEGIVGTCALTGAPQVVPDTRLDPRYVRDDAMRLSELAVPIVLDGRVLGVIDTEHAQADHYRSAHIRALAEIASRAAARLALL